MFDLSSRVKLQMNLGLAVLAIVSSAVLSTPASAAKINDVLGACKRSPGCQSWGDGKGWAIGCGHYGCFECNNGKCNPVKRSAVEGKRNEAEGKARVGDVSSTSNTSSKSTVNRGETAPVKFGASANNPIATKQMGMGGKH
jgi:hypothetical protein